MKETNQELAASVEFQVDLLKLATGAEAGQPHSVPTHDDQQALEQLARVAAPKRD